MRIVVYLDEFTIYYMDKRDRFIVEMKQVRESKDVNVVVQKYTLENLVDYYKKNNHRTELIQTDLGSFIILDKKANLLFIPLCNRYKNIIDYTCSELYNLVILSLHTFSRKTDGKKKYVISNITKQSMHEVVFGRKARKGHKIDHQQSQGLDNRREKLRELTDAGNSGNRNVEKPDGFMWVSWHSSYKKWKAKLTYNKEEMYLGCFEDKLEAAKVRDIYVVHFAHGIKPLNQIDGKNILCDDEVQDVLRNGIPQKYQREEKSRDLPTNISKSKQGTYRILVKWKKYFRTLDRCSYVIKSLKEKFLDIYTFKNLKVEYDKEKGYFFIFTFTKYYPTLEEAKNMLNSITEYFTVIENEDKSALENDIDKYRNKDGVALLPVYDGTVNEYIAVEIDDHDWKIYIHYIWHMADGYPCNDSIKSLHLAIFKDMDKLAYENKDVNETVDHIDRHPYNVRRANLRLASKSQQSQNREITKDSCIKYTGVTVSSGKFYATVSRDKESEKIEGFIYVEDAAKKHNKLVLKYDKDAKLNVVPNTKTTSFDMFYKKNITVDFILKLNNVLELFELFRVNKDWQKQAGINLKDINRDNLVHYRNLAVKYMKEEINLT